MELLMNNGIKIPAVGLGTYLIKDANVCKTVVKEALKVGYRLIDTAAVYQNEEFIGEVLQNLNEFGLIREDVFITTKLSPADQGRGQCRAKILEAIGRLKTPYLDLVLIHWPGTRGLDAKDPKVRELRKGSYEDLEDLHKEGLIRSIGVSNYMVKHLDELLKHCKIPPAVNQVEFHPLLYQKDLLDYCKKNNIIVQAYSSLGAVEGWKVLSKDETLIGLSKNYSKTVPQILLRWALQHGLCVIPKTSKVENLKPNFDLFSFEISSEDMSTIDGLNSDTRFCWDPNNII